MPSYTKKAIEASFVRILNEHPLANITVKMIVEDCCVNRNTFYYYFQDIPALLEEIIVQETNRIIDSIPDEFTFGDAVNVALNYISTNKKAVLHLWDSTGRDVFEVQMMKVCEYIIKRYIENRDYDTLIDERSLELVIDYLKCEFFGQITNWLNNGMSYDVVEHARKLSLLFEGTLRSAVEKNAKKIQKL